jgi:hypothetical protein
MNGTAQKGIYAEQTTLTNTYTGFNFFISSPRSNLSRGLKRTKNKHKIVLNYIVAGGSGATEKMDKRWSGLDGYRRSAFIAQYQFKF